MGTRYEDDVILWSQEQARALRERDFSKLDIEHLADEIEDVGESEKRELASRMAVLLAHLLKWRYQLEKRGASRRSTIKHQRNSMALLLKETPSLKAVTRDPDWQAVAWGDASGQAAKEMGVDIDFGDICPWTMEQVLDANFWPDA